VEADRWSSVGPKISSPDQLAAIKAVLDERGTILVQHKFLRGTRAPSLVVFEDFDDFVEYLSESARAGDKIKVWNLKPFLQEADPVASGKCPAEGGPTDGAVGG
jgi:hypothetical protein